MSDFPTFHAPRPDGHKPERLIELARFLRSSSYKAQLAKPLRGDDYAVMPRSRLLAMLQAGALVGLNAQEWAIAVDEKAGWDAEHPDLADATARAMWEAALFDPTPRELLLRRVALQLAAGQGRVAASLLRTFDHFAARADAADAPVADLIVTLLEQEAINAETGANLTFDILKGFLLEQLGLE